MVFRMSVIVPVYNAASFLDRCIQSIQKQSIPDIEIILVDDGSTDTSGQIVDAYAQGDRRIQVVHQKNAGLPKARNQGIEIARGTYLTFVDADGWIDSMMCEQLCDALDHTGADVCFSGLRIVRDGFSGQVLEQPLVEQVLQGKDKIWELRKAFYGPIYDRVEPYTPCGARMGYRRDLLMCKNIRFGELLEEDVFFNLCMSKSAKSVCAIAGAYYNYRAGNHASITHSFSDAKIVSASYWFERLYVSAASEDTHASEAMLRAHHRVLNTSLNLAAQAIRQTSVTVRRESLKKLFMLVPLRQATEACSINQLPFRQRLFVQVYRRNITYAPAYLGSLINVVHFLKGEH